VAKFPCVAANQMPTPRTPQPPSWDHSTGRERGTGEAPGRASGLLPQGPAHKPGSCLIPATALSSPEPTKGQAPLLTPTPTPM
jgi:hypothetical protein